MVIHHATCRFFNDSATFNLSQHYKPRPISTFRRIVGRIVAILIGLPLLVFVYYYIRYDFLPKDLYTSHVVGEVAGIGLLLTVGILWSWFKGWRRSLRRSGRK